MDKSLYIKVSQIDNLFGMIDNIRVYAAGLKARNKDEMYNLQQIFFETDNMIDILFHVFDDNA